MLMLIRLFSASKKFPFSLLPAPSMFSRPRPRLCPNSGVRPVRSVAGKERNAMFSCFVIFISSSFFFSGCFKKERVKGFFGRERKGWGGKKWRGCRETAFFGLVRLGFFCTASNTLIFGLFLFTCWILLAGFAAFGGNGLLVFYFVRKRPRVERVEAVAERRVSSLIVAIAPPGYGSSVALVF